MAAYRRRNMLAGIRGIQGRDRHSRGLSAPIWSRYGDRVGVNRVKSLRSKRPIARVRERWCGGHPTPGPSASGVFVCPLLAKPAFIEAGCRQFPQVGPPVKAAPPPQPRHVVTNVLPDQQSS